MALATETALEGEQPLLQLVMQNGKTNIEPESLETIRQRTADSLSLLPATVRQIDALTVGKVEISRALESLRKSVENKDFQ